MPPGGRQAIACSIVVRQADRLEREVRTAAGQRRGSRPSVAAGSAPARTRRRRPELAGQLELGRHPVDGDDRRRPGQRARP